MGGVRKVPVLYASATADIDYDLGGHFLFEASVANQSWSGCQVTCQISYSGMFRIQWEKESLCGKSHCFMFLLWRAPRLLLWHHSEATEVK